MGTKKQQSQRSEGKETRRLVQNQISILIKDSTVGCSEMELLNLPYDAGVFVQEFISKPFLIDGRYRMK